MFMMRSLDVLLAVAVLLQNMGACPQVSALTAPAFLGAKDVAALLVAELRQEPVRTVKSKASIAFCIFLAVFGSVFGCIGVGIMYGALRSQQEAALFTGDDALEATATITSRKTCTQTFHSFEDGTSTHYHNKVSYCFEAVRQDGVRCRITVTDQEVGAIVFESCREGSRQQVNYLGEDPRHCRLTQAAENDMRPSSAVFLVGRMLLGLIFAAAGCFVGIVVTTLWHGPLGFLICGSIWLGLVGCCIFVCVGPFVDNEISGVKGASLEELGMQQPSSRLTSISVM